MNARGRAASALNDAALSAHGLVPKLQRLLDAVVRGDAAAAHEHVRCLRKALESTEGVLMPALREQLRADGRRDAQTFDSDADRQAAARQWLDGVADLMPAYNAGNPYGHPDWPMKGERA